MRRQKFTQFIARKSLLAAALSLLFLIIHTVILISTPVHAAQPASQANGTQTHASENRSCIQQCSPNTSEPRLGGHEEKEEDDSPTPFKLLLAAAGSGIFVYLTTLLIKYVRRKIQIPIYKQVACFRI